MNRPPFTFPLVVMLAILFLGTGACELVDGTGGTSLTPATQCLYDYTAAEDTAVPDFGLPCTAPEDCAYGVCMVPSAVGNITNDTFGFCTRGCDCDCVAGDACPQSVKGSDPDYSCVYPGGCFPGESKGQWRYVVPKCSSVDDCKLLDERYTHCTKTYLTNTSDSTCGQEAKVCMAISGE